MKKLLMTVIEVLNEKENEINLKAKQAGIVIPKVEQLVIINNIYLKKIIAFLCATNNTDYDGFLSIIEEHGNEKEISS